MTIYVSMLVRNMIACLLYGCSLSVCRDPHNISTKEGAKKALEAGKSAAVDVGKKSVTKALTPKSKKILQKYTEPATQDINTLIDGSAIAIQDLVKKLNSGAGN